jgi:hypothetical protein
LPNVCDLQKENHTLGDLKIYRKIDSLACGFLFFVISISGPEHVENPNICYYQPEEVSSLFEVVESLDMEDLKLTQLLVNIST